MFFWTIAEPLIIVLAILFAITQLIIPGWRGTPAFPFFRHIFQRKRKVAEKIRILNETKEVKDMEKIAQGLEQSLKKKRRS